MPAKKKSTKKNKLPANASLVRQVHHAITQNFEVSVAMVSILLNVFFVTGFVLYHTSSSFETKIYRYATERFCSERNDDVALRAYELTCHRGSFQPYYEKAKADYQAR